MRFLAACLLACSGPALAEASETERPVMTFTDGSSFKQSFDTTHGEAAS